MVDKAAGNPPQDNVPAPEKPKAIQIQFSGTKGPLSLNGSVEALSAEGKLDRNNIMAAGRHLDENSTYDLIVDDQFVARMIVQGDEWVVTYPEDAGKETERFARSETKRPHRTGSRAPRTRDRGPDLMLAVTRVIGHNFPQLKATAPKRAKRPTKSEEIEKAKAIVANMVATFASVTGISIEEARKQLGIEDMEL